MSNLGTSHPQQEHIPGNPGGVTPAADLRNARKRPLWQWGLVASAILGILVGVGFVASHFLAAKKRALPIVAKKLPPRTLSIVASRLRQDLDEVAVLPNAYIASALEGEVCGGIDTAQLLGHARGKSLAVLRKLGVLDLPTSDGVRTGLRCGDAVRAGLIAPTTVTINFADNDKTLSVVALGANLQQLPSELGFQRHAFSGLEGQCLHAKDAKTDCPDDAVAAFHDGTTWFFGTTTAIDAFARSYTTAREELTTTVDTLQEAIESTGDSDSTAITAKPESIPWQKPCLEAAPLDHKSDFANACFPKGEERLMDAIVAKVRGVALQDDILGKSARYAFTFLLVARDDDSAKDLEKDVQDLARDWRAQLSNSEPDLAKLVRAPSDYVHDDFWKVAFDPFMRAMRGMKVSRSGRVVRLVIDEALVPAEAKSLKEFVETRTQDQIAATSVIDALIQHSPLPEKSLANFVSPEVAWWMVMPKATDDDCVAIGAKLKALSKDVAIADFGLKFQLEKRYAKAACVGVGLPGDAKTCLLGAGDLKAFAACPVMPSAGVAVASRKLEGQWTVASVDPATDATSEFVGAKLEVKGGRAAFQFGTAPASEGDANVQSDDGDELSFSLPNTPTKTIRMTGSVNAKQLKARDSHTTFVFTRGAFDAPLAAPGPAPTPSDDGAITPTPPSGSSPPKAVTPKPPAADKPSAPSAGACVPCMYNGRCARLQTNPGTCCEPITADVNGGTIAADCRRREGRHNHR
jgi:hypothetical protein